MKVLIVDDEKLACDRLNRMVSDIEGYDVVGEAADGVEAVQAVQDFQADIVLLDIRMPGMDGLEAAEHMSKMDNPPAILFCTAYEEHAVAAFEVQAVGYLLKPVRKVALIDALERASRINRVQLDSLRQEEDVQQQTGRTHISAKTRRGIELVPVNDICFFMAEHKYVTVRYGPGGEKEVLIDQTLKELESEFIDRFVRIHRNALVAVDYLEGLSRTGINGQYQIRLRGIEGDLTVSRRHVAGIRKLMQTM